MESLAGIDALDLTVHRQAAREIDWAAEYAACAPDLFGFLARRIGRELAEDLLADTFMAAMSRHDQFDADQGTVRTWLFGIASNLVRRHWRTEERRLRALARDAARRLQPIDPLLTTTMVDDRLDAAQDADALIDELGRLEPIDRELLALTGWELMSSTEAGAIVGMKPATVRSRVRRARARLRSATERGSSNS